MNHARRTLKDCGTLCSLSKLRYHCKFCSAYVSVRVACLTFQSTQVTLAFPLHMHYIPSVQYLRFARSRHLYLESTLISYPILSMRTSLHDSFYGVSCPRSYQVFPHCTHSGPPLFSTKICYHLGFGLPFSTYIFCLPLLPFSPFWQ